MEQTLPMPAATPAPKQQSARSRWISVILTSLILLSVIVPGWHNLYNRLNYGSQLDWQGQKIQLPLNWAIQPPPYANLWGNVTLQSYQVVWIPFLFSGPAPSTLMLSAAPAKFDAAKALAMQGYIAQKGGYSGFIPTASAGEYSCIAKTGEGQSFLGQTAKFFNLRCFQQEKGWSFNYFGSPAQVNQVFAMLAPVSGERAAAAK